MPDIALAFMIPILFYGVLYGIAFFFARRIPRWNDSRDLLIGKTVLLALGVPFITAPICFILSLFFCEHSDWFTETTRCVVPGMGAVVDFLFIGSFSSYLVTIPIAIFVWAILGLSFAGRVIKRRCARRKSAI